MEGGNFWSLGGGYLYKNDTVSFSYGYSYYLSENEGFEISFTKKAAQSVLVPDFDPEADSQDRSSFNTNWNYSSLEEMLLTGNYTYSFSEDYYSINTNPFEHVSIEYWNGENYLSKHNHPEIDDLYFKLTETNTFRDSDNVENIHFNGELSAILIDTSSGEEINVKADFSGSIKQWKH